MEASGNNRREFFVVVFSFQPRVALLNMLILIISFL